jgi:hypothetical protein
LLHDARHSVALQLDMGEEEKRGLVYIVVLLGWFVFYLFKTFFIVFEVLEKKLEVSFYFSVLPKRKLKKWKSCSFI